MKSVAPSLATIEFDEQDANLFQVDDPRLRADALKHSVLPRLNVVMHEAIGLIRKIYGIEPMDDSIVSMYPNFRTKRENDLKYLYDSAFVGLGGQHKDKWPGVIRKDGKVVQILPFRFAFMLTEDGLFAVLHNAWLKGLSDASFEQFIKFYLDNEAAVNALAFHAGMRPEVFFDDDLPLLAPIADHYRHRIKHRLFDNHYAGHLFHFPIQEPQLRELIENFASFFPLYDACIQIAKDKEPRFHELLKRLSKWYESGCEDDADTPAGDTGQDIEAIRLAAIAAGKAVRVMPALRWQVFQRDQWRCVSCGRTSHAGTILHVDHILPRSLGGKDVIENFQTLCESCNLGKSNRDSTDLRRSPNS